MGIKKDIGFWDINGNYIEDIQEITMEEEIELLRQENENLYEEKNCLHKIIDRLLENAGYSKDIASAEDFEDVYEDMQIKRNELIELEQENAELKGKLDAYLMSENEANEIIAELKAENERLKEEFEIESLTDKTKSKIYYRSNVCNKLINKNLKLKKILQEIKEITEFHITDADSEDVQNDMKQILDLITKTESEG